MPALAVALAAVTALAFSSLRGAQFISYDDACYVTDNEHVLAGVSASTVTWAVTATDCANWHPLTWISHAIDVTLWGRDAGKHHETSVALHVVNAVLLLLLLNRMTGAPWRSAIVAGLFALHPLHVESVAWIAERKDVLCTGLWFLALGAWAGYVARPSIARYTLVVALFALGLAAKPMLVTFPLTVLLVDVWPLRRRVELRRRVHEMIPFALLSLASCIVTFVAQRGGGSVRSLIDIPFAARLENALVSYAAYLGKAVWPTSLAAIYPFSTDIGPGPILGSLALLVALSVAAYVLRHRAPYLTFGWCWYVGTLVPVIGLVQVGGQAMADRYTYVPLFGIFVAATWGIAEAVRTNVVARAVAASAAIVVLVAAFAGARAQARVWHDGPTLFAHTLEVTSDNWIAHNLLANELAVAGRTDEAVKEFAEAMRLNPAFGAKARFNMGNTLTKAGRLEEGIASYRQSLELDPRFADAQNNLGYALFRQGKTAEAIAHYEEALRLMPSLSQAQRNLDEARAQLPVKPDCLALASAGRFAEAIPCFERVIASEPTSAEAHNNLAGALAAVGKTDAAIAELQLAVRYDAGNAEAHFNLGTLLLQAGRGAEAAEHFQRTLELEPGNAEARARLAAARATRPPQRRKD